MSASVMKGFQGIEIKDGRQLEVVLQICDHVATLPNSDKLDFLLPCDTSTGNVTLVPSSKSVFVDNKALYSGLSGFAFRFFLLSAPLCPGDS